MKPKIIIPHTQNPEFVEDWFYDDYDKTYDPKVTPSKEAAAFVESYYNSPGFKERFQKVDQYLKEFASTPKYYSMYSPYEFGGYLTADPPEKLNYHLTFGNDTGSSYYSNGEAVINNVDSFDYYPVFDYGGATAHELGHAIDYNIPIIVHDRYNDPYTDGSYFYRLRPNVLVKYSYIFPHFRKNKLYQKIIKNQPTDVVERFELYPMVYYDDTHDALPDESYADLIAFRESLDRFGIYDSRKANNPFTKEHLNKWKKLGKHLRIFDYFSDDEIIQMMNDIAYIPNNSNVLYAKTGQKLINKNWHKNKYTI